MTAGDVHAARYPPLHTGGEPAEGLVEPAPQLVDEGGRVEWFANRGVMDVTVDLEVRGQIRLRVTPACG